MPALPVTDPLLLALLRYWLTKRGTRALPARRDIDPVEIGAELLPHLVLADLFERGTHVRFRLVGTAVVKRLGADPTGRYLEREPRGGWFTELGSLYRLVYAERAPVYAESELHWGAGRRLAVRNLLLPLTQDGSDPAIALCGLSFASSEVFPPSLRALAESGAHHELHRHVLGELPALEAPKSAGRFVA
jgi:hypothetical protein